MKSYRLFRPGTDEEDCVHIWVYVPDGSRLTLGLPFRFCETCDREEVLV